MLADPATPTLATPVPIEAVHVSISQRRHTGIVEHPQPEIDMELVVEEARMRALQEALDAR